MTLEMKPLGNACNLGCTYCYQDPMRLAGNERASKSYDVELMMKIADEFNEKNGLDSGYTMFGGEALLTPIKDLETFLRSSFEKYGRSALQTNGSLINDDHIALFKKYNVYIGISIDGANDLNSLRVPKSKKQNVDDLTKATMTNIVRLREEGVQLGIIITVHKANGTAEKLPRLLNFIEWLGKIGIDSGNLHTLEVDSPEAVQYALTEEENINAFRTMADFFSANPHLQWSPFTDFHRFQQSETVGACVFNSCDHMNTQAVYGIEGNGQLSNCGMVNKDGIEWTKGEDFFSGELNHSYTRDVILYHTPPEQGGCKGCPYFLMCNGYCTGASIDNDWRNKTYYCSSLKAMFKYYEEKVEKEGKTPFSKREDRVRLERRYINHIIQNPHSRMSISRLIEESNMVKVEVRGGTN